MVEVEKVVEVPAGTTADYQGELSVMRRLVTDAQKAAGDITGKTCMIDLVPFGVPDLIW